MFLKSDYTIEPYLNNNLSISQRSYVAKLRIGTLPLKLETGRYTGIPVEDRLCSCGEEVETEEHFLLRCPHYNGERNEL